MGSLPKRTELPTMGPVGVVAISAPAKQAPEASAKQAMDARRQKLLQGLTDQLKIVMGKIGNPDTPAKSREALQTLLTSIKDKITALTPPEKVVSRPPKAAGQADQA